MTAPSMHANILFLYQLIITQQGKTTCNWKRQHAVQMFNKELFPKKLQYNSRTHSELLMILKHAFYISNFKLSFTFNITAWSVFYKEQAWSCLGSSSYFCSQNCFTAGKHIMCMWCVVCVCMHMCVKQRDRDRQKGKTRKKANEWKHYWFRHFLTQ
jgi:hypothetical protein